MEDQIWNAGLTNPDENTRDDSPATHESEPVYTDTNLLINNSSITDASHDYQLDDNSGESVEHKKDECCPSGYRFKPYDYELIVYYLQKKILKQTLPPNCIHEVDLYEYNPETLTAMYEPCGDQKEWYFLTPRNRKYPNGSRPSRDAGDAYWKAAGADKPVIFGEETVGSNRTLGFYRGKAQKGQKTEWIMHEFKVCDSFRPPKRTIDGKRLDDWVLCKIYKKVGKGTGQQNGATQAQSLENNGTLAPHNDAQILVPDVTKNYSHGSDQYDNSAYHQNSQNGLVRVPEDQALPSIPQSHDLPLEQSSTYVQNTISEEIGSFNMDDMVFNSVSYETLNQSLHFDYEFPLRA